MQGARSLSAVQIHSIAAELKRLEKLARDVSQPELAHFIAAAGDLAKLIVSRNRPPPSGTTTH